MMSLKLEFEPAHEIMARFVFSKLILQTRMRSHPVGLEVWYLDGPFVYFHTSWVRTAKAVARLRECAGSPEPSLVAYVISTIISWAGSFVTSIYLSLRLNLHGGHRRVVLKWRKARVILSGSVGNYPVKPSRPRSWQPTIHTYQQVLLTLLCRQCDSNPRGSGI